MNKKEISYYTNAEEETKKLGETLSHLLKRGDVCTLLGTLGAGKTTFVNGIAKGLGIKENVLSPTFNIMKCYFEGSLPLYHIDAYRLEDQMIDIGLDEAIEGDGVTFIEWPMFIAPLIPTDHLEIELQKGESSQRRKIYFRSFGARSAEIISKLEEAMHGKFSI